MTKSELTANVADSMGFSKLIAAQTVKCIFSEIESALSSGDSVSIIGFGTFSVAERAARTGRNPQDSSIIEIPASNNFRFKAGKALKDAVN